MKKSSFSRVGLLGIVVLFAGCTAGTVIPPNPMQGQGPGSVNVVTPENIQTQQPVQTEQTSQTQENQLSGTVETNDVTFTPAAALDPESVLSQDKIKRLVAAYNEALQITDPKQLIGWGTDVGGMGGDSSLKGSFRFYNTGTLKAAPYKDWNLLVLALGCDGPCDHNPVYRLAQNPSNNDLVILTKYSDDLSDGRIVGLLAVSSQDKNLTIASLDMPKTLAIPDSKSVITLKFADSDYIPDSTRAAKEQGSDNLYLYTKVLFNSTIGPVYANTYDKNTLLSR